MTDEGSLLRDREKQATRENASLSSRVAELEKNKASLDSELKAVNTRYDQLVISSQNAKKNALMNNQMEGNVEQLKGRLR